VVCIDLEGHGREALFDDIDLTRTVGWFTSMFPVRLELPGDDLGSALKAVKEQLRRIPDRGVSYGLLRYLHDDAEVRATLSALPHPDVAFNYLGQFGHTGAGSAAIKPAAESPGPMASALEPRSHLIEINASIVGGRFRMDWAYNPQAHHSATVGRVAADYLATLRGLIEHCRSLQVEGFTPSDFSKARVSQQELDKLLKRIGRGSGRASS
jgi:non-ribosomal peptide synthase protein (TIGR01720 family)